LTDTRPTPAGLGHLRAFHKLLLALGLSLITLVLLGSVSMSWLSRIMICWDIFSFSFIIISLINFHSFDTKQIRVYAKLQDSSKTVVFFIILISTLGSLACVFLLIMHQGQWLLNKYIGTFIYVFGVACSWFLLHIIFTFRYAHLYYGDHPTVSGSNMAGLNFPEEDFPDYLDFAYFSFTIGMCYQVSDVQIVSRTIRRLALLHALVGFLFNTVIVGLVINVILDLKS
jgi:uncharacterized membrane protein